MWTSNIDWTLSMVCFLSNLNAFNQTLSIERFQLNAFNRVLRYKLFHVRTIGNFFHCAMIKIHKFLIEKSLYLQDFHFQEKEPLINWLCLDLDWIGIESHPCQGQVLKDLPMKLSWSCRFCNDSGPRNASVGTRLSLFPFNFTSWNKETKELLPNITTFIVNFCS